MIHIDKKMLNFYNETFFNNFNIKLKISLKTIFMNNIGYNACVFAYG